MTAAGTFSPPPTNSTFTISCSAANRVSASRTTAGWCSPSTSAMTLIRSPRFLTSGSARSAERRLLVLVRLARELDDRLLPFEWVLAIDPNPFRAHLDYVVARAPVAAEAKCRDGAGGHDEQVLQMPGIRHVLV